MEPLPVTEPEPLAHLEAPTIEQAARLAEASNAFAFDLYGQVRGEEGNLVFSPASVSIAFAMVYAGARGETAEQMKRVLHYGNDPAELHDSAGRLLAAWNDLDGLPAGLTRILRRVREDFSEAGHHAAGCLLPGLRNARLRDPEDWEVEYLVRGRVSRAVQTLFSGVCS